MLHPLRMRQRDLKNPSCRKSSDLRQEKTADLRPNPAGFFDVAAVYPIRVVEEPARILRRANCSFLKDTRRKKVITDHNQTITATFFAGASGTAVSRNQSHNCDWFRSQSNL
jgi:hypothetical protein